MVHGENGADILSDDDAADVGDSGDVGDDDEEEEDGEEDGEEAEEDASDPTITLNVRKAARSMADAEERGRGIIPSLTGCLSPSPSPVDCPCPCPCASPRS